MLRKRCWFKRTLKRIIIGDWEFIRILAPGTDRQTAVVAGAPRSVQALPPESDSMVGRERRAHRAEVGSALTSSGNGAWGWEG